MFALSAMMLVGDDDNVCKLSEAAMRGVFISLACSRGRSAYLGFLTSAAIVWTNTDFLRIQRREC
jgi:hypothetical protein